MGAAGERLGTVDDAVLRFGIADGQTTAGLQHHRDDAFRCDALFGDRAVERVLVGSDDDFLEGLRVLHALSPNGLDYSAATARGRSSADRPTAVATPIP